VCKQQLPLKENRHCVKWRGRGDWRTNEPNEDAQHMKVSGKQGENSVKMRANKCWTSLTVYQREHTNEKMSAEAGCSSENEGISRKRGEWR
jgi:hypothetical protein